MPEKPWKRAERQVAKRLGGERVKRHGEAAPDVVAPHLVVEVKERKALPIWILDAVSTAYSHATHHQLPIAVLMDQSRRKTLVVMNLGDFEDWFGRIAAQREE